MKIETVGLIGFGRFGKMAYQYLRRDADVRVYDEDGATTASLATATSFEAAVEADLVLLCVPISAVEATCSRMASLLKPGQIVVDTCSVKVTPVRHMLEHLPSAVQILGTHPLFGPDSGRDGISGLRITLCPVRIGAEVYEKIRRYLENLGLDVIESTPEEHDRQIARTQAVFHLIAQAMKRLGWGEERISTPGPEIFYRLVKTVQNDTPQLFRDLERENVFATEARKQFTQTILELDRELTAQRNAGEPPS